MSSLSIIVAKDRRSGIGISNTLPWRLPQDLAHFKRTTTGHPVIMGRKTFDSIGRPLPGRRNIVVTRQSGWQHEGVEVCHSLEEALALTRAEAPFIIGGAQIYQQAMALADTLVITEIDAEFGCDAFFPQVDPAVWQEASREAHTADDQSFNYAFVVYKKK